MYIAKQVRVVGCAGGYCGCGFVYSIYFVYASNKHMFIVRDPIHILRVHVSYGKCSGHMYNVMYLLSPKVRVAYDRHHHAWK